MVSRELVERSNHERPFDTLRANGFPANGWVYGSVLLKTPQIIATALCVAGAAAIAVYWPGLGGGFFFDDNASILLPEGVRLERLSTEALRQALTSGQAGPSGRPVAQLSFALNHFFNGFDPFAFKATNLAIHMASALLAFFLALRLLAAATPPQAGRRNSLIAAGMLAAAWLLHPIQLLPVLHVVQRMTSLSALFLLAAMLLHVSGRERGGRSGTAELVLAWGVLWPLSFFSKETGALFPCFVLAWELIVRRSCNGGLDRFARLLAVLAGLTFSAGAVYAVLPAGQWLWAGYELRAFTLSERLLTEGRVLWFYLGIILFPRLEALGLYHDDIPLSTSLLEPWTTLPALAGLACLLWLAWWMRSRAPLVSFGIAWFLIGHALESTFLPLEIAHEHRNYVPLFGILLAGVWALTRVLDTNGPRKTLGIALSVMALTWFPFVTALRAHQFGEEGRRTQIEAQHHRASARAHHEAGRILAEQEEAALPNSPTYSFARIHYEYAGELDPASKMSWLGLIHLNCKAGKPVERAWIDELARRLRETPFAPGDRSVLYNMKDMSIAGALCLERADVEWLFAAARANPTVSAHVRAMLHSWLADYLALGARDLPAAEAELERSLALVPHNPSNRLKRAQLDFLGGRYVEARGKLTELRDADLVRSERETLAQLLACLESGDPAAGCMGK